MASQSLYRKWRSQTFSDLVGQEPVVRTLKNALSSGKLAHAYLFTGPRGTGKTSTARLLAKTINCLNPKNGEPCNECQQCREITAGNSFNVIEIDAASNRGIDSIRDLREKIMMPPATGKYKVYVLDEAHMLTTEAFNALLKTLEEPPPYAIFVMATTDVHKMLPTVLSRCQRFDFKRITTKEVVAHLHFVAEQEHVKLEGAAAELVARAAAGGMRDALSLLDQAIAYSGTEITLAHVQAMLGVADPRAIAKLIMHVAYLASSDGLHLIHELAEAGADLRQINTQVMEYWRGVMLAKAGADVSAILDTTKDEAQEIMEASNYFSLEELTECARIFAQNELMQKNQGTPQLGLELAFLSCIEAHRRAQQGPSLATSTHSVPAFQPRPVAAAQAESRHVATPRTPLAPQPVEMQAPVVPATNPASAKAEPIDAAPDWDDLPTIDDYEKETETLPARPVTPTVVRKEVPAQSQPALTVQQVKERWDQIKRRVKSKDQGAGLITSAMLNDFTVINVEGTSEEAVIVIQASHDVHYKYVNENENYKYLEWALSLEFHNLPCRVRLLPPGASRSTSSRSRGNQMANAALSLQPQPAARRERPLSPRPSAPPTIEAAELPEPPRNLSSTSTDEPEISAPLARTNIVRENTISEPGEAPPISNETIREKASRDPVVQEVIRMFGAKIVDVYPR